MSQSPLICNRTHSRHSNAGCLIRPSQTEFRKRAVQVRNGECGVRIAPQFDFRHRQASCDEPARPVAPAEFGMRRALIRAVSAFGVAAFGRKPPFLFPARFAALCRDAAQDLPGTAKFEAPAEGQRRGRMVPGSFKILVCGMEK